MKKTLNSFSTTIIGSLSALALATLPVSAVPNAPQPNAGQPQAPQPNAGQPQAPQPNAGQPQAPQPNAPSTGIVIGGTTNYNEAVKPEALPTTDADGKANKAMPGQDLGKMKVITTKANEMLVTGQISKLMDGKIELSQGGPTVTIIAGPDLKPEQDVELKVGQSLMAIVEKPKDREQLKNLKGMKLIMFNPSLVDDSEGNETETDVLDTFSSSTTVQLTGEVTGRTAGTLDIDTGAQTFTVNTANVPFPADRQGPTEFEIGDKVAVIVPVSNALFDGSDIIANSLSTGIQ